MSDPRPIRFGIVGCGSASVPVCEAMSMSTVAQPAAVYDVNPDMARDLSSRFGVPVRAGLDELLTDTSVDAVYIAVPHHLLAPMSQAALEAGKHVLTEKPLALTTQEVDALIDLASARGLALGVFYEMRYAAAHEPVRELVRNGAIGTIIAVQIQTLIDKPLSYWHSGYSGRSFDPWRGIRAEAGGGVVLMNTSHLIDAMRYITGLEITSVAAEIGSLVAGVEVEDTAAVVFRLNNGAVGTILSAAHIAGASNDECITLYGTNGQLRLPDPYGSNPVRLYLSRTWEELEAGKWHTLQMKISSVYRSAIEDFVRAVQTGQMAPVGGKEARQVLNVVLAIYQSAAKRKMVSIQ